MTYNNEIKNKNVQTFAGDMAGILETDKAGLIKKIIHGEEEAEKEKRNLSPESKKNQFFMLVSFLLLFVALAIVSFFFLSREASTVPVEKQFVSLIFNDQSSFIEVDGLNKDKIVEAVLNKVILTKVKVGGIEGMYLISNKKIVGLREFISLIKGNLAPNNFIDDNFLLGVINNSTSTDSLLGRDFFVLIKVRSVTDVFDSLRAWEDKMFSDLHGFFAIDISSETKYLLTKDFDDSIVENKNARILYDKDNQIVMMYIFADDTSLVVTNAKNATREIILRLASSQIKK